MTNEVYFDPIVGGDGSRVTDDDNVSTGLLNGGSTIRLVPMFQQIVNVAKYVLTKAGAAATSAANALTSANSASDSAIAAANSVTQVNTIGATTGLQTTGAVVQIAAATPPVAGQVLTTTDATHAVWRNATPDFLLINAGII